MQQTELEIHARLDPPYNGLFYCHIRDQLLPWPQFISFLRNKRL